MNVNVPVPFPNGLTYEIISLYTTALQMLH